MQDVDQRRTHRSPCGFECLILLLTWVFQATCSSLEKKYTEADQERNQLIERLKSYKMQEIDLINQANEAENQ